MTADNFPKYLLHFIRYAKFNLQSKCLFILDNQSSHISPGGFNICKENGIVLLALPPHTSHRLQPLDVSVFGPFKRNFNQRADAWMVNNPGKTLTIQDLPELIGLAYPRAFTPCNIRTGFLTT